MPSTERLEVNYRNLDRINAWIANADAKATAVLAGIGLLVAFTFSRLSDVLAPQPHRSPVTWYLNGGTFLLAVILLTLSVYRSLRVLYPRVAPPMPSLLFFGTIAELSRDEFKARMKELDPAAIEEELILQTHVSARIAVEKFQNVGGAIRLLMAALPFLIAHFVLGALLARP
jgi:hypothetical protein